MVDNILTWLWRRQLNEFHMSNIIIIRQFAMGREDETCGRTESLTTKLANVCIIGSLSGVELI